MRVELGDSHSNPRLVSLGHPVNKMPTYLARPIREKKTMSPKQLYQEHIGEVWMLEEVSDCCAWWLELRFQTAVDKGPNMPLQVVFKAADVSEDLAFLPDLYESRVAEAFSKKRSTEVFYVPRRYREQWLHMSVSMPEEAKSCLSYTLLPRRPPGRLVPSWGIGVTSSILPILKPARASIRIAA